MIVLVCGGRDFKSVRHRKKIFNTLDQLAPKHIVTGCATGADYHARCYIDKKEMRGSIFEANWELHGKSAGMKRNQEMVDYVKNHPKYRDDEKLVLAFWDGKSRGTMNTMSLADKAGIRVMHVDMQVHTVKRLTFDHYKLLLQEFIDLHKEDPYFDLRLGQWMLTHDILQVDHVALASSIFTQERISRVTRLLVENDILKD